VCVVGLKDLFLHSLLPPNRKLVPFADHASAFFAAANARRKKANKKRGSGAGQALSSEPTAEQLSMWVFEHELKTRYQTLLAQITLALRDPQEHAKRKALNNCFDLLSQRPEQEQVTPYRIPPFCFQSLDWVGLSCVCPHRRCWRWWSTN
jgi:hypothetical protein